MVVRRVPIRQSGPDSHERDRVNAYRWALAWRGPTEGGRQPGSAVADTDGRGGARPPRHPAAQSSGGDQTERRRRVTDTVRDAKLVQYLNEAYGKEKELEIALEAHIGMTTRKAYLKRLRKHLTETRDHARRLERRIKRISGEGPGRVQTIAGQAASQAMALAEGPLHAVRGTGEAEKMLKNAKTEYFNEHEEIATYTTIEALAEALKDADTAELARSIRRDERRMARFLEGQIAQLARAVVREEVPASERRSPRR
jgi:ferritin-like metal-binding protein YciE